MTLSLVKGSLTDPNTRSVKRFTLSVNVSILSTRSLFKLLNLSFRSLISFEQLKFPLEEGEVNTSLAEKLAKPILIISFKALVISGRFVTLWILASKFNKAISSSCFKSSESIAICFLVNDDIYLSWYLSWYLTIKRVTYYKYQREIYFSTVTDFYNRFSPSGWPLGWHSSWPLEIFEKVWDFSEPKISFLTNRVEI